MGIRWYDKRTNQEVWIQNTIQYRLKYTNFIQNKKIHCIKLLIVQNISVDKRRRHGWVPVSLCPVPKYSSTTSPGYIFKPSFRNALKYVYFIVKSRKDFGAIRRTVYANLSHLNGHVADDSGCTSILLQCNLNSHSHSSSPCNWVLAILITHILTT